MESLLDFEVVIPAYNAERTIHRAITSAQEAGARRIVVVDDGSGDKTAIKASAAGVTLLKQQNSGAAAARAAGLREVTADFVVFLDADDELLREGITSLRTALSTETSLIGVVGAFTIVRLGDPSRPTSSPWNEGVSTHSLLARGTAPAPPAAIMWRTSAVLAASTLHINSLAPRYAEDFEEILRMSIVGPIGVVHKAACLYSVEGGKSAQDPLRSLRSAERTRNYYAEAVGVRVSPRPDRTLRAMVQLRKSSPLGPRSRVARCFHLLAAVVLSPGFIVTVLRQRRPA